MSVSTVKAELEVMIAAIEAKKKAMDALLDSLRGTVQKIDDLPAGVVDLLLQPIRQQASGFASAGSSASASMPSGSSRLNNFIDESRKTQYRKIVEFFLRQENKPATVADLAHAIRASRSAISNVVYRTHKEKFASQRVDGEPRLKRWSLRPEIYRDAVTTLGNLSAGENGEDGPQLPPFG